MKFCKCLKTNLVPRNLLFWVFAKKQQLPPLCSHPFRSNNHFTFQFSVKGGDGKNWEVHSHAPQLWACSCFPTASPSPQGTFWISPAWLSLWPHTSSAPLPSSCIVDVLRLHLYQKTVPRILTKKLTVVSISFLEDFKEELMHQNVAIAKDFHPNMHRLVKSKIVPHNRVIFCSQWQSKQEETFVDNPTFKTGLLLFLITWYYPSKFRPLSFGLRHY